MVRAFVLCLVSLWTFSNAIASQVFVAQLNPTVATGEQGDFLSSAFDFGTRFSLIESVSLQVTSARGFSGYHFSTDAFVTFSNSFNVVVDEGAEIEPTLSLEAGVAGQSTRSLTGGEPTTLELTARSNNRGPFRIDVFGGNGGNTLDPDWPSFLLNGRGRVALINVRNLTFQEIPGLRVGNSNTEWFVPEAISDARLTIVATVVPEPGYAELVLTGVLP